MDTMRIGCLVLAILTAGVGAAETEPAGSQPVDESPFVIPPNGQGEKLIGALDYDAPTALAFDSRNRPYMMNMCEPELFGQIVTLRGGKWVKLSFLRTLKSAYPRLAPRPTRYLHAIGMLTIDDADGLYAAFSVNKGGRSGSVLVFSPDLGRRWQIHELPGGRANLELRVGHNDLSGPPAIAMLRSRENVPGIKYGSRATLSVIAPRRSGRRLVLGDPVVVTDNCLTAGSGGHSGGTSCIVTGGSNAHVVYTEVPETLTGGNPTYVATVDRRKGKLVAKKFLIKAAPKRPDSHSRPTITIDSEGFLHVVAGSHGQPFYYFRSLKPGDITGGWTDPFAMSDKTTYAALICDLRDRLHLVFRQWRPHATLGYHVRTDRWAPWRTLVHGANRRDKWEYGIFYHRLTVDRAGALYLSFTFFENRTKSGGKYPRALAVSTDGGETWRLATRAAMATRVSAPRRRP